MAFGRASRAPPGLAATSSVRAGLPDGLLPEAAPGGSAARHGSSTAPQVGGGEADATPLFAEAFAPVEVAARLDAAAAVATGSEAFAPAAVEARLDDAAAAAGSVASSNFSEDRLDAAVAAAAASSAASPGISEDEASARREVGLPSEANMASPVPRLRNQTRPLLGSTKRSQDASAPPRSSPSPSSLPDTEAWGDGVNGFICTAGVCGDLYTGVYGPGRRFVGGA